MKIYFHVSGTHGYPEVGLIAHMKHRVGAIHFYLSYFYDADILINMADRQKSRHQLDKKEGE